MNFRTFSRFNRIAMLAFLILAVQTSECTSVVANELAWQTYNEAGERFVGARNYSQAEEVLLHAISAARDMKSNDHLKTSLSLMIRTYDALKKSDLAQTLRKELGDLGGVVPPAPVVEQPLVATTGGGASQVSVPIEQSSLGGTGAPVSRSSNSSPATSSDLVQSKSAVSKPAGGGPEYDSLNIGNQKPIRFAAGTGEPMSAPPSSTDSAFSSSRSVTASTQGQDLSSTGSFTEAAQSQSAPVAAGRNGGREVNSAAAETPPVASEKTSKPKDAFADAGDAETIDTSPAATADGAAASYGSYGQSPGKSSADTEDVAPEAASSGLKNNSATGSKAADASSQTTSAGSEKASLTTATSPPTAQAGSGIGSQTTASSSPTTDAGSQTAHLGSQTPSFSNLREPNATPTDASDAASNASVGANPSTKTETKVVPAFADGKVPPELQEMEGGSDVERLIRSLARQQAGLPPLANKPGVSKPPELILPPANNAKSSTETKGTASAASDDAPTAISTGGADSEVPSSTAAASQAVADSPKVASALPVVAASATTQAASELRQMQGHIDWIKTIAFAPDTNFAASAGSDQVIRYWDVSTGKAVSEFRGHKGDINGIAFSRDGSKLVSGSDDRTVRLFNVASASEEKVFNGHKNLVTCVALSPDMKRIASGGYDNSIIVWNADSGSQVGNLTGHTAVVRDIMFTPDGQRIVSCSDDRTIIVWNAKTLKPVATLQGHDNYVLNIDISEDGKQLLSGGRDLTARLWDLEGGKLLQTMRGHTDWILRVKFMKGSNQAVTGGLDKTVRIWDLSSGALQSTADGFNWGVFGEDFAPDKQLVLTGSNDKTVRVWSLPH